MTAFENIPRKSFIEIGNIYFFTATINGWQHLLLADNYKQVIIDSLTHLHQKELISVYAFVIMPNHIHMIFKTHKLNGKETVQGSLLKFTAHAFRKLLLANNAAELNNYKIDAANKKHEFWQRDSKAFHLTSRKTAIQKLEYIHNNPVAKKWNLANTREDYFFSSAKFYATNIPNFPFLKHLLDEF